MSSQNKKAYTYKMKLVPANILCTVIILITYIGTILITRENPFQESNTGLLLLEVILYFCLHEILHGIGYKIGGANKKNIQYGASIEKGIFYAMAYQELTKKAILISLQMPFMVIGVITYIIGLIFHIPTLLLLSVMNFGGAAMDIAMFIYISKLKNVTYSESGNPDEFVLISTEDLTKRKSMYLKIVDVKDYKKEDYIFEEKKKIVISKASYIILGFLILLSIISFILK